MYKAILVYEMFKPSFKSANMSRPITFVLLVCLSVHYCTCKSDTPTLPRKLAGVRFLITVNDTWADPPGCITTIATDMVQPKKKSGKLDIGSCDQGPIEYTILSPGKNYNKYTLSLIFHSSVIEDASPPACDISWNGSYLVPQDNNYTWTGQADLLPSCFVGDSREGYHMTYYWFHLLEWFFADDLETIY